MLHEIETAVKFLSDFLRSKNNGNHNGRQQVKKEQVDEFSACLQKILLERFQGHWHPAQPWRGSGFRCIINQSANGTIDPILLIVGRTAGIPEFLLRRFLPVEMAVWIDPNDVSYRIGEQGSICSLLGSEKENIMDVGGSHHSHHHQNGGRYHTSSSSSISPPAGGRNGSRTNSFSFSPRSITPEKVMMMSQQQQQQLLQQHQQQQQRRPESLTTSLKSVSSSATSSTTTTKPQTEQSNDSGIELSPSTSPRPSAANTISNSSSPTGSPLASPIREQHNPAGD